MNDPAEVEFGETEIPHALYRLYDADWVLLRVGITRNIPDRFAQYRAEAEWWLRVAHRTMVWHPNELDARIAETIAIDAEEPLHNIVRPAVGPLVPPHGQRAGWHRTKPKAVRLPAGLRERIELAAEAEGVTVNAFIVAAIEEELERREALESAHVGTNGG